MALDHSRTLRGALAGGVAAAAWLLQEPFDQRVFRSRHGDAELLGRLALGSAGPRPAALGALLHLQNGAVFGALYANVAPHLPLAPALRGPLAGLVEHLVTWPSMALVDPALAASPRAFAQATWRHLLFGAVLGELERRLNPTTRAPEPVSEAAVASNGHGSPEHLVASGPAR